MAKNRTNSRPFTLTASKPKTIAAGGQTLRGDIVIDTGSASINASGAAGAVPTFEMAAYTGGPMMVRGFREPLVVDVNGIEALNVKRPILLEHDYAKRVGHAEPDGFSTDGGQLIIKGTISAANEHATEVIESAKKGFPWQASIGATILESLRLAKGKSMNVNGRTVVGPAIVATRTRLNESSFVTLGADENTSVTVAAERHKGKAMKFADWLKSKFKLEASSLSADSRKVFMAQYQAAIDAGEIEAAGDPENPEEPDNDDPENEDPENGGEGNKPASASTAAKGIRAAADTSIAKIRAEHARAARINVIAKDHPEIAAEAIRDGWSVLKTENKVLKASTPAVRASKPFAGQSAAKVLEASAIVAAGVWDDSKLVKEYGDATLQAAHDRYRGRISLGELIIECAVLNGYTGRHSLRDPKAYNEIIATGFSNAAISGILSNISNKRLLEGFTEISRNWANVAKVSGVSDFKKRTAYRMTVNGTFQPVGADGLIKNGTLGEKVYDIQADEYGLMVAVTRKMIRNDDLGAITDVPRQIGYQAGQTINQVVWGMFLAGKATMFTAPKGNLMTAKPLTIDNYIAAETLLRSAKTDAGQPIGASGRPKLLVPPALAGIARQIMSSQALTLDAATATGTSNPAFNRADVIDEEWIGGGVDGGSDADWFVLRNSTIVPLMEVAFLDNIQTPRVETEEADFEHTGGIKMKGQLDFGAAFVDERGGVMSDN